MQEMFEAVLAGATDPEIKGVEVVRRPALPVSPTDMLEADGYLLGSPANLGYMSGALKHYLVNYSANTIRLSVSPACPTYSGRSASVKRGPPARLRRKLFASRQRNARSAPDEKIHVRWARGVSGSVRTPGRG
jgi:hypothetical protein